MKKYLFIFTIIFLTTPYCLAHGFSGSGVLNPILGFDHMIAVFSVGFLATKFTGKKIYYIQLLFLVVLLLIIGLNLKNLSDFTTEIAISISIIMIGLMILYKKNISLYLVTIFIILLSIFQGLAIENEVYKTTSNLTHIILLFITVISLQIAGITSGMLIFDNKYKNYWIKSIGVSTIIIGCYFLVNQLT
jgi:urease accessory protein